jgi:hypothetical protein
MNCPATPQASNSSSPNGSAEVAANFAGLVGSKIWAARLGELGRGCAAGQRTSRAIMRTHIIEITLERLRRGARPEALTAAEAAVLAMAGELCAVSQYLEAPGRQRLRGRIAAALQGAASLVPIFHIARAALRYRRRGFEVDYSGFADAAPFDLTIRRDGTECEVACEVISAEEGRDLHRGAWVRLVDRIDPDLQTWLAAHPGRYLLKMTLPQGLRSGPADQDRLANLHGRIRTMLQGQRRADHDEAAVLRLDPLMLAGSQADELGLMGRLRREFGHEAHLAVTTSEGGGVFVMAARAAREDSVAVAIRERLAALAPVRLTGERPGILAILLDDTDRVEWAHLCDRLVIEGEARQFLTRPEARGVVAVTCASRLELLDEGTEVCGEGELRFRNPSHPFAKAPALAPAVLSTN